MSDYTLILTDIGQAKIADAIAHGTEINLTQIAFGDGNGAYYEPTSSQTALVHEVKRININNKTQDSQSPNKLIIEGFIPATDYGYQIREMGIFDSTGAMIAVKKYPFVDKVSPQTGALIDLYIKEYLIVTSITAFNLIVDPTAINATQNYVNNQITTHNSDINAHDNSYIKKSGDTMTGNLIIPNGIESGHAVNKGQLDAWKVPAGCVFYLAQSTAPEGFLKANGAAISRTAYVNLFTAIGTTFGVGDGSTTFNLPDLRGEFLRAWDDFRGVDSGRVLGSFQTDEFKSHNHNIGFTTTITAIGTGGLVEDGPYYGEHTTAIRATGGTETRPRNIAFLACIKY